MTRVAYRKLWRAVALLCCVGAMWLMLAPEAHAAATEPEKDGEWDVFPTKVKLKPLPDGTTPGRWAAYTHWIPCNDGRGTLRFPTEMLVQFTKSGVRADLNGNGSLADERLIKASKKGAVVRTNFTYGDGSEGKYATLMSYSPKCKELSWTRACYRQASVYGQTLVISDDSNNGTYSDYGKDGVAIAGSGSYMSDVVVINNELYDFKTDDAGSKVWLKKHTGSTGTLKFRTTSTLKSLVVGSGSTFIQLATFDDGLAIVPAGDYMIVAGKLVKGKNIAFMEESEESVTFHVAADAETELKWGPEMSLSFEARGTILTEGRKTVRQLTLKLPAILGSGGEEYFGFRPQPTSYQVSIIDEDGKPTGKYGSWHKVGGG